MGEKDGYGHIPGQPSSRQENYENDGRSVKIDTSFYTVQSWGDTDDSFEEVMEKAVEAADRAKEDIIELDDRMDGDDEQYH